LISVDNQLFNCSKDYFLSSHGDCTFSSLRLDQPRPFAAAKSWSGRGVLLKNTLVLGRLFFQFATPTWRIAWLIAAAATAAATAAGEAALAT
jgi:hypothetical protein